ncbi:hypothetical protein PAAG_01364 [Paracoccidioides lutzii Pb01]|uniref:Hydrophobin n=1 Tax=Paracoccidioides lutzii (strain ATCC MYA-826 / Pb01) TaxID=502779 RepID=C1GS69_PARBA|nr:hypothetical protein PAAG_01364 [Paracoccidioides lutzii Pb01]EEH38902.2 hypothetical protein PAAG_01364 [Paracoccidioides lutzii Pb01]
MKLQFLISAFAFISSIVNAVALPPSHQPGDMPDPLAIRDGRPSGANCNSVPQCCKATHSSEDRLVIQGLKLFGLDQEAGKSKGSVATQCKQINEELNLDLINGCNSNANGLSKGPAFDLFID